MRPRIEKSFHKQKSCGNAGSCSNLLFGGKVNLQYNVVLHTHLFAIYIHSAGFCQSHGRGQKVAGLLITLTLKALHTHPPPPPARHGSPRPSAMIQCRDTPFPDLYDFTGGMAGLPCAQSRGHRSHHTVTASLLR